MKFRNFRWIAFLSLVALPLFFGSLTAQAQQVLQLLVPPSTYNLSGFTYEPPQVDGWRQTSLDPAGVEMIYAETKDGESVDTRCHVVARAFPIPSPEAVEGLAQLAEASRQQQYDKRRDEVIGLSPSVPLADSGLYTYSFVVKSPVNEEERGYEDYYVTMAPDKSEYLIMQLVTRDEDFRDQLYFNYLLGSLASLRHRSTAAKDGDSKAAATEAPAVSEPTPAAPTAPAVDPHAGHNHP